MSAPRRRRLRDRLGRFTTARRALRAGAGAGLRARVEPAARRGLAVAVAALRSEPARRLGRLAVVAAALAGAVVVLYAHGDSPAALARTVQAPPGPATPAAQPSRAREPRPGPGGPPAAATPTRPGRDPTRPADVAAAWYAARSHLPAGRVQPLQQDAVSAREVRVLVLADHGDGRLDTALVTVRRDAAGRWSVP